MTRDFHPPRSFSSSVDVPACRRLAVEHVPGMLAAGDSVDELLRAYPWLEREDVLACLAYTRRVVGHERIEPGIRTKRYLERARRASRR